MSPLSSENINARWEGVKFSKDIVTLSGIKFGSLNVRSLVRKMGDIVTLLHCSDLEYLGLSESWLNFSISDNEIAIPGYTVHRFDRDAGNAMRGGGGLVVYAKSDRNFEHLVQWSGFG